MVDPGVEVEIERTLAPAQVQRRAPGALDHADEELGSRPAAAPRRGERRVDAALPLAQERELGREEPAGAARHAEREGDLIHVVEVAADAHAGVGEVLERVERAEGEARRLGIDSPATRALRPSGPKAASVSAQRLGYREPPDVFSY